jgi:general secretion pathway protein C
MLSRLSAFVVWSLVAATVVFWGLRLLVQPRTAPAYAVAVGEGSAPRGDLSRLLGAAPTTTAAVNLPSAPEMSSRFKLIGVMAPKVAPPVGDPSPGLALIAVDGKPPRAFPVGAALDGELVLQAVSLRSASIGPAQGATAVKLELPPLPPPATGTLAQAMTPTSRPVPMVPGLTPSVTPSMSQPVPSVVSPAPPAPGPGFAPGAVPTRNPNQN